MVKNDNILGWGQLHFNSNEEAQIRYMAVDAYHRKQGIGTMILKKLEEIARKRGAECVVLNARESAIEFYKKNDYHIVEKSYILFGSIQHFKMMKKL
ncbi:MAG: GNAT family N-acetyltransferase [Thermoplasmata archaeon]|nr:GNAT family N-acetyltransferase [Thermoplasmata archaeon]